MAKKKRLRGLNALLASTITPATGEAAVAAAETAAKTTLMLPIEAVVPNPEQPRKEFDEEALQELAASIKAQGVVQPVVVCPTTDQSAPNKTTYRLIAGERRLRAAKLAELKEIPAVVKENLSPDEILLVSLVENLQREDLNPLEESRAYRHLADKFSLTQETISAAVGKSRSSVANSLRLLELPTSVQDAVGSGKLSVGHAKVLLGLKNTALQARLAARIQAEGWSVRRLEQFAADESAKPPITPIKRSPRLVPPHIQELEARFREYFGTRVRVEEGVRKGRIIIEFYSVEDFDRITACMGLAGDVTTTPNDNQ